MAIKRDNAFTLSGVTSNFCMKYTGDNFTRSVLGRINIRPTKNRNSPPKCGNGFATDRLAFAKGHVMALELGGSDDQYNVVPQFEHWQGKPNGEWRQLEEHLRATFAGKLMLVEMTYTRGGGRQSYENMLDAFVMNRLIDWTDERIPDGFTVRVWDDPLDPSAINTDNDTDFDSKVAALKVKAPVFSHTLTLGNTMPEPDRNMYIYQTAIDVTLSLRETKKYQLKKSLSDVTFMLLPDTIGDVRNGMATQPGVTPVEAKGIQLCPLITQIQAITPAKIKAKRKQRVLEGMDVVSEDEILHVVKKTKFFHKKSL